MQTSLTQKSQSGKGTEATCQETLVWSSHLSLLKHCALIPAPKPEAPLKICSMLPVDRHTKIYGCRTPSSPTHIKFMSKCSHYYVLQSTCVCVCVCVCDTPSTAFWHLPPNSARFSYATEGALFISTQLSSNAVSAFQKVQVLIWL